MRLKRSISMLIALAVALIGSDSASAVGRALPTDYAAPLPQSIRQLSDADSTPDGGAYPELALNSTRDLEWYAREIGVTLDEAILRSSKQQAFGRVAKELEGSLGSFVYAKVEHSPALRFIVGISDERDRMYVPSEVASTKVMVSIAPVSRDVLMSGVALIDAALSDLVPLYATDVDLVAGVVRVIPEPEAPIEEITTRLAALSASSKVRIALERVERSAPTVGAWLYGGSPVESLPYADPNHIGICTAGYTVVEDHTGVANDLYGFVTAGHCGNDLGVSTMTYDGGNFPLSSERIDTAYDTQVNWYLSGSRPSWLRPNVFDGYNLRPQGSYDETAYVLYTMKCKYGRTTSYGCGFEISNTYKPSWVPSATSTFIRVHNDSGLALSEGGDSGGPVFFNNGAAGIISGKTGSDLIFNGINHALIWGTWTLLQ